MKFFTFNNGVSLDITAIKSINPVKPKKFSLYNGVHSDEELYRLKKAFDYCYTYSVGFYDGSNMEIEFRGDIREDACSRATSERSALLKALEEER